MMTFYTVRVSYDMLLYITYMPLRLRGVDLSGYIETIDAMLYVRDRDDW